MKEAQFSIDGMTCGGCVAAVRNVLTRQPGVTDVKVDIGSASLSYDEAKVSLETLFGAVERAGFQPKG
jgi:copper chaperone CopZ